MRSAPLAALPRALGIIGNGGSLLERRGHLWVSGAGTARRASLTPLGKRMRNANASAVAATGRAWRARHGPAAAELAGALAAVDARLPAGPPDQVTVRSPAGGGFADVSAAP